LGSLAFLTPVIPGSVFKEKRSQARRDGIRQAAAGFDAEYVEKVKTKGRRDETELYKRLYL